MEDGDKGLCASSSVPGAGIIITMNLLCYTRVPFLLENVMITTEIMDTIDINLWGWCFLWYPDVSFSSVINSVTVLVINFLRA